jgi:putative inorganic carbon (hco3(-)) transporter
VLGAGLAFGRPTHDRFVGIRSDISYARVLGPLALVLVATLLAAGGTTAFPRVMLLVAALSIAWLVWVLPPAVTLTAAVVLSPLASNWLQLGVPGAISPDRLLLIGGIGVMLVRAPGARSLPQLRLRPTHAVLAAVLVYALISAAAVGTLVEPSGFFRLFDAFGVLPFLVFFIAPSVFATPRSRAILLAALVGLGAYLGLTALFEATKLDALVFPRFIAHATAGDPSGRAFGIFLEPVSNGAGLFDCGVAAAVALVSWRRPAARGLAALTVLLCAVGTFFTLERSVWLGTVAALLVTLVVFTLRARRAAPGIAATAGLVATAAILAGAALWFAPGLAHEATQRANDQGTVYDRRNLANAAQNMIAARPLFGFGWSTFERRSLDYFQQSPDYPLNPNLAFSPTTQGSFSVHNEFLDYAVTLGLVGTAIWLGAFVLALGGAFRARTTPELEHWRFALLPVVVFYLVIENAVPPALFPNLLLWLWLGVVWVGYEGRARAQ